MKTTSALHAALRLGLVSILCCSSSLAQAQTSALPVYVSDRFVQVARKTGEQIAVGAIKRACPDGKPPCTIMLGDLAAAALSAAEDRGDLKARLNDFFVSSSTAAVMELTLGPLVDAGGAVSNDEAKTLAPIAVCLSALVSQRNVSRACALAPADLDAIEKLVRGKV